MTSSIRLGMFLCLLSVQSALAQGLYDLEAARAEAAGTVSQRRAMFGSRAMVIDEILALGKTSDERDGLLFLLSSMTLADIADQDAAFHLDVVREALYSRNALPWGAAVPNDLFLHFVLPPRSGNEILDTARALMQRELFPRIANLSMRDAVLEINHWCHEHVSYQPTDARTSSPLATMRSAAGRCGEESVFTVAALRSACIPARQCYTPRWAHSDDNHAWVEVWVDGVWHFLGACEPAPDLDDAWFTEPARRAMLTATTVHGRYLDREEVIFSGPYSTRVNTLPWYAPTRRLIVEVADGYGIPVAGSIVDFRVFNYSELYPIASVMTDSSGQCGFVTGLGDLLVWARKDDNCAHAVAALGMGDTLRLILSQYNSAVIREEFEIAPPAARKAESREHPHAKACEQRKHSNDSIRGAYQAGFIDSTYAVQFAQTKGLSADSTWSVLHRSAGNWPNFLALLDSAAKESLVLVFPLLSIMPEKDLRDASASTLLHHLRAAPPASVKDDFYVRYVLNPRIRYEELRPWRGPLSAFLPAIAGHDGTVDAARIIEWIRWNIRVDRSENWSGVSITPEGSLRLRISDPASRDVLFVAMCRTAGIPARIDPVAAVPQYRREGRWVNAGFERMAPLRSMTSHLRLLPQDPPPDGTPVYGVEYTLARYEHGRYVTLDYESDERLLALPALLDLESGDYMLTTGIRRRDGSVPVALDFFSISENDTADIILRFRENDDTLHVLGRIDPARLPQSDGTGWVFLWLQPGAEPTTHLLNDLALVKADLRAIAPPMFVTGHSGDLDSELRFPCSALLPEGRSFFIDAGGRLLNMLLDAQSLNGGMDFPVIIVIDSDGSIYFVNSGYTIGIGTRLLRILTAMRDRKIR